MNSRSDKRKHFDLSHIRIYKEKVIDTFQNMKNKLNDANYKINFESLTHSDSFLYSFQNQEIVISYYNFKSTYDLIENKKDFLNKNDFLVCSIYERLSNFITAKININFINEIEQTYLDIITIAFDFKLDLLMQFFKSKSIEFEKDTHTDLFQNKMSRQFNKLYIYIENNKHNIDDVNQNDELESKNKKKFKQKQEILFKRIKKRFSAKNKLKCHPTKKKKEIKTIPKSDVQCIVCQESIDFKSEYSLISIRSFQQNFRTVICKQKYNQDSYFLENCKHII